MSPSLLLSVLNGVLLLTVLGGLAYRGRLGISRLLPLHLAVGFAVRVPVWLWPEEYGAWDYWFFTECLQVTLRLGLAVELTRRALGALPRGLARAQGLQFVVLVGLLAVLVLTPQPEVSDAYYLGSLVAAKATYASAWLFVAFLAVVWYHGIPTEPLHREVAIGFTAWSLVAGISPELRAFDGLVGWFNQVLASLIYPAVLLAWARTAWAPNVPTELSPASLAILRPWRA